MTTAMTTTAPEEAVAVSGDIPVVELVAPLPGFAELHRFALARVVDDGTVCELRSLDAPDVSFVVVPPSEFFAGYTAEVGDDVADALDLQSADDALVLAVVTLGSTAAEATANLRAPIVVNHRTRRAMQVILDDPELPLKAPLAS